MRSRGRSSFPRYTYSSRAQCKEWCLTLIGWFFVLMSPQPPVGLNLLHEVPRSHSHTPHSVGLLWTSDRPFTETSTWQHTTITRDRRLMSPAGFEPAVPASETLQTHYLDRGATGIDISVDKLFFKSFAMVCIAATVTIVYPRLYRSALTVFVNGTNAMFLLHTRGKCFKSYTSNKA
jgi:hypothetical protein